jgi:hypothetical protein
MEGYDEKLMDTCVAFGLAGEEGTYIIKALTNLELACLSSYETSCEAQKGIFISTTKQT